MSEPKAQDHATGRHPEPLGDDALVALFLSAISGMTIRDAEKATAVSDNTLLRLRQGETRLYKPVRRKIERYLLRAGKLTAGEVTPDEPPPRTVEQAAENRAVLAIEHFGNWKVLTSMGARAAVTALRAVAEAERFNAEERDLLERWISQVTGEESPL
jgi:hypothetical protein